MSPLDWFTPSASGWSTYQVGAADHPPAAAEPPAGPVATPEFTLRVASDPAAEDLAAYVQYAIETEPVPPDWPDLVEVEPPPPDPPVSWEAQVLEALPQLATNMNRTLAVQDSVAAVVDATVPTPVSSRGFAVRFDYCLVRLDRPWWDEIFLSRRDWRLPGYQPGEISNGSASGSGAPVSMVTIGMLVVRDLSITADWSDRDLAALPTSTSLGPFCIAAGGFDSATGTLTRKGLQVIAWLVQIPPVLPPRPARPV
jgi:2-oxoglutarate dehydrogenase E2 component (dihydrolipoamide succinyltransferase)